MDQSAKRMGKNFIPLWPLEMILDGARKNVMTVPIFFQ